MGCDGANSTVRDLVGVAVHDLGFFYDWLIVDVMLPEFAGQTNAICSHVLASSLLQRIYQRVAFLNRLPGRTQFVLHFLLRNAIRVVLPVQRRLRFVG